MKKFRILLITLFLLSLTSLIACYAKSNYPLKTKVTFKYWMPLHKNVSTFCKDFGTLPFAKELQKRTGVKIQYIHPPKGLETEALNLLLTSDALPDMFEYNWLTYPGGPNAAIQGKYIINLNQYIDQDAVYFRNYLKKQPDIAKRVKTDDGNFYAFPFIRQGNTRVTAGPIIRQDWLEELHLAPPNTLAEWYTVLKAFKERKKAAAPFTGDLLNIRTTFSGAFNAYQLGFYVENNQVKYGILDPGTKNFFATMQKWYAEGLIDKNFSMINQKGIDANILNGQSGAFYGSGGSGIGKLTTDARVKNPNTKIKLFGTLFPTAQKGTNAKFGNISDAVPGNSCAISTKCKNVDIAVKFLDYSYSPEGHLLYNFGIEGVSYKMVNGYPKYTNLITHNPKGLPIGQTMAMYFRSSTNGPFKQDPRYLEQYYTLPEQHEASKLWAKCNQAKYNLPPITPGAKESAELGKIMHEVTSYVDDMTYKFIMGVEPISRYDQFVAQIKKMKIARAIAIQQAAYNRFKKR